ncbi:MAG: DUF5074 domain-containing protein, partial [Rikenellaceae bacterium]
NDKNDDVVDPASAKMLILNEGGYTRGNSSLSTISYDNITTNKVFETVNKKPLGDVGQSICYSSGKYYIAMNNSKKVQVISANDYKLVQTITIEAGKTIPMYMAEISNDKIVLCDAAANVLWLIDTKTDKLVKSITIPGKGSKMIVTGGKLFVSTGNNILVFDCNNIEAAPKTIAVSVASSAELVLDKNGNIWALTSDKKLTSINAATNVVAAPIEIPKEISLNVWSARLAINQDKDKLYFNGESAERKPIIYEFAITAQAPKALFTIQNVKTLYNMAISPDNQIVVCDALDYVQDGYVYTYKLDGTKDKEFHVGIIPQYILFTKYNKN